MAVGVITWSKTAANNSNADSSVNWAEGMAPSAVNDSARTTMASIAKWRDDLNATLVASGVSTGLTLTTNQVQGALTAGYEATFVTTFGISSPATINVDTLGPKPLRRAPAAELLPIAAGQPVRMNYFTSNSGEWIIQTTRGVSVVSQIFTSTQATTYTPTTGMLYCIVEAIGGGGAGGASVTNVDDNSGGGGGAGGTYTRAIISATAITTSQIVTVGAGGTASSSAAGGDGNPSSLGSLVTASGGLGGAKGIINAIVAGGAGGSTGTGDLSIPGQNGDYGNGITAGTPWGGAGGNSHYGWGGRQALSIATGSTGHDGTGYGAGGGGAVNINTGTAFAAAGGKSGIVIITEFV